MSERASILVVEDDENLRLGLEDNLQEQGYAVTATSNGDGARAALADGSFDLIILDIMLPDTDGYSLCKQLRADGCTSMVLMLTARTLEEDIVRGFEAGADDYLAKPYRLAELLARVKALLRRSGGASEPPQDALTFGAYQVDLQARNVSGKGGQQVTLTKTEFDLLVFFLGNNGRALHRQEILDEVWGTDVIVDGRTVDNFVSNLKKKLSWTGDDPWRISTIRGVGYRFELE